MTSRFLLIGVFGFAMWSCQEVPADPIKAEDWSKRTNPTKSLDSLESGTSYLSIYSQIYSFSERKTHSLTAMVSLRNTSISDSIYILSAEYYNTTGALVRTYLEEPIFLEPLSTTQIVIDETDNLGGTASSFLFSWKIPEGCPEPFFEAVMNSTMGQQGLSFTTQGKRIR